MIADLPHLFARERKIGPRRLRKIVNDKPVALYRHYDLGGGLLYVGISLNQINRLARHMKISDWRYHIRRVEITWFPNRKLAEQAEQIAIETEKPFCNRTG